MNARGTTLESIVSDPREIHRGGGGKEWRNHGITLRAQILTRDETIGSGSFVLSNACDINRYYMTSEKVFDQFIKTSIDNYNELIQAYLTGNRLVKILSTVLPTHRDYLSQRVDLARQRNKSQALLVRLLQFLEQLALIIDKEEHKNYIKNYIQVFINNNNKEEAKETSFTEAPSLNKYPNVTKEEEKKINISTSLSSSYLSPTPPRSNISEQETKNKTYSSNGTDVYYTMQEENLKSTQLSQDDFSVQSSLFSSCDFLSLDDSYKRDGSIDTMSSGDASSMESASIQLLIETEFSGNTTKVAIRNSRISGNWENKSSQDYNGSSNFSFNNSSETSCTMESEYTTSISDLFVNRDNENESCIYLSQEDSEEEDESAIELAGEKLIFGTTDW
eukprot:CAMPEP_0194194474 /NCGR_PEP_ID=MMETSP0154-20130528/75605_1 /TAXON_ID=1049557 /ORGANISM="Thalassiothrix antarctica, Strain L6-D1" /LENGTH=390 /DNA_ID=CAMNT_0038918907 /DNA_START=32 /DNA_END=1201 /DNA_ORIENTATION=+